MFKLELDMHLKFVPPMEEHAPGIVLTRTIELPFPPTPGLHLAGKVIDDCPDPLGFRLEDLTWDIDRQVFLAHTSLTSMDEPMAFIPDDLRSWIDRGWRLGSYVDSYGDDDGAPDEAVQDSGATADNDDEYAQLEMLHTLPRNRRHREFNQFFKAMVRYMAETHNNSDVAYAMDKLGRFVPKEEPGAEEPPLHRKWREARSEFEGMPLEDQLAWRERVERYPTLEDVIP